LEEDVVVDVGMEAGVEEGGPDDDNDDDDDDDDAGDDDNDNDDDVGEEEEGKEEVEASVDEEEADREGGVGTDERRPGPTMEPVRAVPVEEPGPVLLLNNETVEVAVRLPEERMLEKFKSKDRSFAFVFADCCCCCCEVDCLRGGGGGCCCNEDCVVEVAGFFGALLSGPVGDCVRDVAVAVCGC
jgi:hypothetical protein